MGYVDPTLMRTRYWAVAIDGAALPDQIAVLLDDIDVEESIAERNKCTITFNDPRNAVRSPGGGYYLTLNDVATGNGHYFFERNRVVTVAMGYDPNRLVEIWDFVLDKVIPEFPESGDAKFKIECLSRKQQLRLGRTTTLKTGAMLIRKLSDVVVPIATNHKLSYHLDDAVFGTPEEFTIRGTDTDQTILERLGSLYGRTVTVLQRTLVFIHPDKVLYRPDGEFRYQLCYRCGDNSCKSFKAIERNRSTKAKNQKRTQADSNVKGAYLDDVTGAEHVIRVSNDGIYGIEDSRRQISEVVDYEDENLQVSVDPNYDDANYTGERVSETSTEYVNFWDGNSGTWVQKTMTREVGPSTNDEVTDDAFKNPSRAEKQAGAQSKKPNYDAEIEPQMFDPYLKIGVQLGMFGLGVRWSGAKGNKYVIQYRHVHMSRSSGPSLTLKLTRFRKPKPVVGPANPDTPANSDASADKVQDPYTGRIATGLKYSGDTAVWRPVTIADSGGESTAHTESNMSTPEK